MPVNESDDNQLRVCYRGVLTQEEAQAKLGDEYRVLELRPAQCLGDEVSNQLVPATEVIFAPNRIED
jgi:hypothetical protein